MVFVLFAHLNVLAYMVSAVHSTERDTCKPDPMVSNSLDGLISAMAVHATPASAQTSGVTNNANDFQVLLLAINH